MYYLKIMTISLHLLHLTWIPFFVDEIELFLLAQKERFEKHSLSDQSP